MKALYIIYLVVAVAYSLYCYKMLRDEEPQSERKNLILSLVCASTNSILKIGMEDK